MFWNKRHLKVLIPFGAMAAIALITIYKYQNRLLYMPDTPIRLIDYNPIGYRNPQERGMEYEDVQIITRDNIRLRGWFIHQNDPYQHRTIIFMHENAGSNVILVLNIGQRLDYYQFLFRQFGVNILTVAYRGYSYSEGNPNEEGLKIDAEEIINYALHKNDKINKDKLYLQGRSLGGAVSIYAAQKFPNVFKGIIIENTFTSIPDMVDHLFSFLRLFKWIILRIQWHSIEIIDQIESPILFVTGDQDELVPQIMTQRLYDQATRAKFKDMLMQLTIYGGTHNDTWMTDKRRYIKKIKEFMEQCEKMQSQEQKQQKIDYVDQNEVSQENEKSDL